MSSLSALLMPFCDGVRVGLLAAMPIGSMAMLCMQRTMARGVLTGVSTGLGAATVNVVFGALTLTGLGLAAPWLTPGGHAVNGIGGLLLLRSALRAILRPNVLAEDAAPAAMPTWRAAFGSALLISATNPVAAMSIVALLAPLRASGALPATQASLVLAGMFIAACAWWVCFSAAVALLSKRLDRSVIGIATRTAGVLLSLYAMLALLRSLDWHKLPL